MFNRYKYMPMVLLEADGVAPGGGEGLTSSAGAGLAGSAEPQTPAPDTKQVDPAQAAPAAPVVDDKDTKDEIPKYSSQLNPKRRDSEEYKKYLYKHKDLNEVAEDYVSLSQRMEKALELPGKDATPEQVKEFMQKLGVPEKEADYDLPMDGGDQKALQPIADEMRKQFMRAGMTKTQAKTMWSHYLNSMRQGQQILQSIKADGDNMAKTFDARLAQKLESSYPVKAEREGAMKEAVSLFKQHVSRTGLGKAYKESGLLYNPDFILAISRDEKSRSGSSYVEGRAGLPGEKSLGAFGSQYHESFKDSVGGR